MTILLGYRQKTLKKHLVLTCIVALFSLYESFAQTPVTQYQCDPRSNANGGNCPTGCTFFVGSIPKSNPTGFTDGVEKGCNCFDNLDNDGDGKTDAADPGCATYFGLEFVGEGSDCSITPPGALTPFDLVGPHASSGQNTADTQSKVIAGDVDGNGTPDLVISSKWNSEIRLVSTATSVGLPKFGGDSFDEGDIIADFNADGGVSNAYFQTCNGDPLKKRKFEHEVLTADIDGDGAAEIFAVASNRGGGPTSPPTSFWLLALKLDEYGPGGLKPMYNAVCLGSNRPGTFGIADMDGDGKAEIYLRDRIFAAETGKLLASEGGKLMTGTGTSRWDVDVTSAPVAVDMDRDFTMELVCGAQIYKIPNLTNRNPASPGTLTLWKDMNTLTFDVNSDGVNDKYYVKLMNDPAEYGVDTHSSCSVADVDKDGNVDVVLTGAIDFPLGSTSSGRSTVFYWNVAKNRVTGILTPSSLELGLTPAQTPDYANYISGWIWGTGRINIGDANGDGNLDFSYIAGAHLFCMTPDVGSGIMSSVWAPSGGEVLAVNVPSSSSPSTPVAYRLINDTRSGVLTVTIYDFDNNGVPEMVYRDSKELRVIYGTTGLTTSFARTCFSHTYTEGPIVADVNGDGNTDIAVACNRSDNSSQFDITDPINNQNLGEVRIWYSDGEWLPTRKVWNQPGYFVVNINDDLTLPFPQFDIATQFGNVICPSGIPGPQTPFNVFLNQVPFVNGDGCPVFPAPDLEFVGQDPNDPLTDPNDPGYFPTVFVESPICGNLDIKVGFNVTNSGDLPINTVIPVSFYQGSPYAPSATSDSLLFATTITISNLAVGDTLSIGDLYDGNGNLIRNGDLPFIQFDGPGTIFDLYVVLYNDGSVLPIDTTTVSNGIECDITNNFWPVKVIPTPFTVNIDSIDNVKCIDSAPDNGQLISHISVGADTVIDLSPYSFQWYLADQVTPANTIGVADSNYYMTDLPEGDYYLVITNDEKGCSSDPILGQVVRGSNLGVEITVNVLNDQTACTPPNGSLEAVITAGTSAGVTWSWSDEFGQSLGVSGPILTGVPQGRYIVEALKNGCPAIAENVVQDFTNEPDVTGTVLENVVNCLNANTGAITAEAFVGGFAQDSLDYQFDWYFYDTLTAVTGSILPSSDGRPTKRGLAPGSYKVVVTETATGCTAGTSFDVVTITDATVLPDIQMVERAPQTSCDATQPNGRLQADAVIGGDVQDPASFTFEWFVGQNTVTPHLGGTSGTNGQIAENVMGGGQSYTVRITTQNDCSVTMDTVIAEVINYPQVGLVTTPNSVCDQDLGFTGSVTSTVTFDGVTITAGDPNYTFTWYDGPIEDPAEERTADLNQQAITQLDSGFYTLVVENTLLHCPSVANVEQVLSIKALPLITIDSDSSTNCAPNMPGNGRAFVSDVDGLGTGSPYSYQWYTSTDTTGNVIPGETAFELTDIQGAPTADFTVLVRNNTSGCENISSVNVSDQHVLPLLSATVLPDNICDVNLVAPGITRTGEVNLTIDNIGTTPITDYAFDWTAEEPGVGPFTTQNLTQVDSGYYTVTVLQTVTGCESELTRFVPATTTLPVIQTMGTPSTNCEPLVSGNGSVEVISIDGNNPPVGNYTYQWYTSTDTTGNAIGGATQALMANIQGGSGVEFTVLVIDRSNGCANISDEQVLDNHLNPVIAITPTPNSICDEDLSDNPYNGAVTSVITNLGTSPLTGALSDYLYTWTDLEDGTIIKNGVSGGANAGELITALDSSDYSLTVVHQLTGCVSNLDVTTVDLDVSPPTLSATMTPSTNCLPQFADGTAYLSLANGSDPAVDPQNFVWQWYAAQDTSAADLLAGETDYIIIDRQGGPDEYYTVLATNRDDGCQNTATVKITDAKTRPVITLGATPNQQCEGTPGGTAYLNTVDYKGVTLTRPDLFAGFTFGWATGQNTAEITNQPKGVYKLAVTSNVGCTSDTVQTQIVDQLVYPVTVFQKTPQTSCDTLNNPNGEIIAGVTQIPTDPGFSFTWFTNNAATSPLNAANIDGLDPAHVFNLRGNRNFTVIVQNTTTLCRDTVSTFLQEILRIPVIAVNATPITDCNVPGLVTATVNIDLDDDGFNDWTPGDTRFEYTWYRGKADQDPVTDPMLPETGEVLNFLDAAMTMTLPVDNYAAFVTDTQTSCASEIEFDFVNGPPPLFDISSQVNFKPASCGPETGAITAFVTTGGPTTTGYTFEWYAGAPVDPSKTFYTDPPVEFVDPVLDPDQFALQGTALYPLGALPGNQATTGPLTGPTLYGRATGTYSVVVTRDDGCQEYHTAFLPFETAPVILVADIKPTECSADNGEVGLTLDSDPDNTTGNTANQYRLWLLAGTNPDLSVSPNDPSPFLQTIASASGDPVTDRFVGLGPGTYTAVAQEDPADGLPNGCFSNPVTFTMVSALPPNLSALSFEENTNCGLTTLGDGSMQITFNMREDDPYHPDYLPQPIPPAQFITTPVQYSVQVFEVLTGSISNLPGPYNTGAMVDILNMRSGDFDVTVTSTAGCSVTKTYTIGAAPVVAELVDGDLTIDDSFTCDPGGAIEVTTIGIVGQAPGSGVIGEYEFRWYKSKTDADNNANLITSGQGDVAADIGGDYFDAAAEGQPTGTYWVVARKTTGPGTGCLSAPFDGFINDLSKNPSGQMYAFNNTACTDSTLPPIFEGRLEIEISDFGSLPAGSGYSYTWLTATTSSALQGSSSSGNNADRDALTGPDADVETGLEHGAYVVRVENDDTGCFTDLSGTIDQTELPVIISDTDKTDQLICLADGSMTVLEVQVNSLPAPIADFEFYWYKTSTTTPTILEGPNETVLDPVSYTDMGAGTYHVIAVRVASSDGGPGYGCRSPKATEIVLDDSDDPVFQLTPLSNTSCSDVTFEGSISILVTDEGSAPAGAAGYKYTWTEFPVESTAQLADPDPGNDFDGDADNDGADGDQDNPTGLLNGTYKLTATNNTSGCSTSEEAIITLSETPVIISKVGGIDRFVCAPAGRAFVTEVIIDSSTPVTYTPINPAIPVGAAPFSPNIRFAFYEGFPLADSSNLIYDGLGESHLDSLRLPDIKATTYYVVAQNKFGPGLDCQAREQIIINDKSLDPEFEMTPFSNTSCDLVTFDGSISVEVTTPGSLPATDGYDYEWVLTPTPGTPANSDPLSLADNFNGDGTGIDGDNPTGLKDGTYTLRIVNANTLCESRDVSTTIGIEGRPNVTVSLGKIDRLYCLESGQIRVKTVSVGTTTYNNTQFDPQFSFEFFEGSSSGTSVLQGINQFQLDSVTYAHPTPTEQIKAGVSYFVVATNLSGVGLSCTSVPLPLAFNDISVSPIPTATPFANSSCTGVFSNGSVKITVKETSGPGVGALYDYEGFAGGTFGPADFLSNNGNGLNDADMDSIMNLAEATYTWTVRNQVTNCPIPAQVTISYDPVASLPNIVTVDTNNPFDCFGNGGDATVSAITIGSGLPITGSPALDPPSFRYDWYDNQVDAFADPTVPGNLPTGAPTDGRFLTTLTYGTYFVKVRDLLTDCESTPVEVPIDSIAIPFPKIVIDQTRLQMSCDTLNTGSAQLAASISGDITTTYRFTWYDDLFGNGNLLQDTDPTLVASDTLSDLKSGNYSVTAYSSITGCESTQLFIVPDFDPAFLPRITLSGNPRTSCIFPNGSVVVKVEPFPTKNGQTYLPDVYSTYDFTLNIYDGDQKAPLTNANPADDPTPINTMFDQLPTLPPGSFEVDSLDSGLQFTIRLIDNNTTCIVAETTIVSDDRRDPVPAIKIDNPLTNCDERVNGQLSATADGGFTSDYIFRWWDSATPPPAGDTLSYINKLIGADQGDYTVLIVNKISGCDTLATGTIVFEPKYPTPPTIELIQPNDICWENYWPAEPQARPNGWLKANVEGQTAGYDFNWYVGDFTRDEIAAQTIDTTGINYLHLTGQFGNDPGVYTVSAVDLITGCYSVLSSVVPDERVIPEGFMTTTPSRCDDVVTIGTGSAELNLTNTVILRDVTWFDSNDFQVGQGVQVFNLFPGDYRAEILTNQFCEGEITGTIRTEIHAFNLVSVNGDSKNDDWQIDCISDYPNNNVKIFNRYGVKVYEADGYDNGQVVFRGIGENGVYTLGNSLPDGTYFFIIDKRDGVSKPITGFLELVH